MLLDLYLLFIIAYVGNKLAVVALNNHSFPVSLLGYNTRDIKKKSPQQSSSVGFSEENYFGFVFF